MTDGKPFNASCDHVLLHADTFTLTQIAPCANRRYAQKHGLGFVYASNPLLTVAPASGEQSERAAFLKASRKLKDVCRLAGATMPVHPPCVRGSRDEGALCKLQPANSMVDVEVGLASRGARALAVFSRCDAADRAVYLRTFAWCKLALLAEVVARLPYCSEPDGWAAFMDADVMLTHARGGVASPPLASQLELKEWLNRSRGAGGPSLFVAREPPGAWDRGSVKDAPNHRNVLKNTVASSGFLMASAVSVPALSDWFCAANGHCDTVHGGPGCYRVDWPHDQGSLRSSHKVHGHPIMVAKDALSYNSPQGTFAHHFWFKTDPTALSYVRHLAKNLSQKLKQRPAEVSEPSRVLPHSPSALQTIARTYVSSVDASVHSVNVAEAWVRSTTRRSIIHGGWRLRVVNGTPWVRPVVNRSDGSALSPFMWRERTSILRLVIAALQEAPPMSDVDLLYVHSDDDRAPQTHMHERLVLFTNAVRGNGVGVPLPDYSFAGWGTRTPPWCQLRERMLSSSRRWPWAERYNRAIFSGANHGPIRKTLFQWAMSASSVAKGLVEARAVASHFEARPKGQEVSTFLSQEAHCRYRYLLSVPVPDVDRTHQPWALMLPSCSPQPWALVDDCLAGIWLLESIALAAALWSGSRPHCV